MVASACKGTEIGIEFGSCTQGIEKECLCVEQLQQVCLY